MTFRQADEADLAGEYAVYAAAQEELHSRRGATWQTPPFDPSGQWAQIQRHLLAHDGERCFVAEEGARIVGFTAALVRGGCWFFSALFVDPAHQGQGVGQNLLELAWDGARHARRMTITEAIQPVSNGLYARRGLLPMTPVLGMVGRPAIEARDSPLRAAEPTPDAMRAIDGAAYGFDRGIDHEFWSRTGLGATLWLRNGEPCAYSYRGPTTVGPVAGRDPRSAAEAMRAELAQTRGEVRVDIPGTATMLVEVALRARLRFIDPGLLLVSPGQQSPPTSVAFHSYWLL